MNGQTFSSLSLTDNSNIDLGSSSLTFFALASVADGKSLSIIDYTSAASPNYAFRFLGDDSKNAAFLSGLGLFGAIGLKSTRRAMGPMTAI
jgi:hypothetical protein